VLVLRMENLGGREERLDQSPSNRVGGKYVFGVHFLFILVKGLESFSREGIGGYNVAIRDQCLRD